MHYFEFSTNWSGSERLCGTCGRSYDGGEHIEITTLKPYTSYVCPDAEKAGRGHSSKWTGAYRKELRSLRDHLCLCGKEFVEEDHERWELTYEVGPEWRPVSVIRSRHGAHPSGGHREGGERRARVRSHH